MPDIAPLLIAILSLVATVTLGVALYGRRDLSSPRCRRCKADVREKAMDASFTCACGAELLKRRAVTFPYRLRRRWAAVGLAFALAAIVLGVVETRVLSIGFGWRAAQPDWYFRWAWPYGDDQGFDHEVLAWHVRNLTSRAAARELLDAVIKKPLPRGWKAEGAFASLLAKASPDGERAARTGEFIVAGMTLEVDRDGRSLFLRWPGSGAFVDRGAFAVRVERITRDGVPIPFETSGDPIAGIDGAWRGIERGNWVARLKDGDLPRLAGEILVYGELVCPPSGVTFSTLRDDPILAVDDDAERWGLDLVRCRFAISSAATPTWNASGGGPAPAWSPAVATALGPFLGGAEGFARRPAMAAAQPVACAAVGILVGLVTLAGIVAVRLVAVSPWALDAAACARCRSHLRGAGTTLPLRCSECGVEVNASGVRYALRMVVWPLVVVGGVLVAIVVLAGAAIIGPRLVSRIVERHVEWTRDAVKDARWLGNQVLADTAPLDLEYSLLDVPLSMMADVDLAFARAISNGWREAVATRTHDGRPPREIERMEWFLAIARVISAQSTSSGRVPDAELTATIESMRDAWHLPGVALPRAVRVRESIVPRDRIPLAMWRYGLRLRYRWQKEFGPNSSRIYVFSNLELELPDTRVVGVAYCDMDWTLTGNGVDAEALASLCGTVRGTVRVLPNDGRVTVVTDPALNPLDGGATVTLEIRETGERDLVTITADDAAVGVALAGSWRLGDASGGTPPRVLTRQSGGPWAGLVSVAAWTGDARAGAFDERPDEVVATFVPEPNAGPIQLDRNGTVTILWGLETTVRFRRVPQREFDMVARYELVP